jgi:hypothetical protein
MLRFRSGYTRMIEGKASSLTPKRVTALERIGVLWNPSSSSREGHLSELADYRKIHGHCNVPRNFSENSKLGKWAETQRANYMLHLEGKTSSITFSRIQELEFLGFEWNLVTWRDRISATWEDRLSELVEYRKIHGHCNVPNRYCQNSKLGNWVGTQRGRYKLHLQANTSYTMALSRIQALESLGFEWSASHKKGTPKKPSPDDDATRVREGTVEGPDQVETTAHTAQTQEDLSARELCNNQGDVALKHEEPEWNAEVHLAYIPGRTAVI